MSESITAQLATLASLDKEALSKLWAELFNASPPVQLRKDLIIPVLAYRMQERAFGSLSPRARNRLRQLAKAFSGNSQAATSTSSLRPGTRLVREWRDEVHLVNVEINGYEYKGGRYKSLSQIARLITGTRWSGPLFFGINLNRPKPTLKGAR